VVTDRLLDQAVAGPLYLARPEIADLVVATLLDGQDVHHLYILHAFVVMPNHVRGSLQALHELRNRGPDSRLH
jgi:hypothetical protein